MRRSPELTRFRRRFRRAAVVSLLLNLVLFAVVGRFFFVHETPEDKNAPLERVTIEHIVRHGKPRPVVAAAAAVPRVAPKPAVVTEPKPAPAAAPRRVAVVPTFAPRPKPIPTRPAYHAPKVVANLEHPEARPGPKHLDNQQIAAIEANLGNAIAQDREKENPLNGVPQNAPAPVEHHYGPDYGELTSGGLGHRGLCYPIKSWTDQGYDYYYLTCNVRATDGTFDREDVPWPVRFKPTYDPFVGTAPNNMPVALPLPGWHLSPGQPVADGIRQYALAHGVDL